MSYMRRLLFYNIRVPIKKGYSLSKRSLISASSLGLDRFLEARKLQRSKIKDAEKFLKEMEEVSHFDNDTLIFSNDIKKTVMLVSDENLEIITKLLKKLSSQNQTLKFQRYNYGPDIMKLYHIYNKPKEALALIENKDTVEHLLQITSFSVLGDLLFNNGLYQEVILLFHYFQTRINTYKNVVQAMVVLYLGACYKLNCESSLDEAISQWKILYHKGLRVHKRGVAFLGLLSIYQNKPQIAMEMLDNARPDPINLSIKAMGLAKSRRYNDVFHLLKNGFTENENLFVTCDAISYILNLLSNDKIEHIPKFNEIVNEMKANKYISQKTLDQILCEDVEIFITYKGKTEQ